MGIISFITQCRKDETTSKVVDSTQVMDSENVTFFIVVVDEDGKLLDESNLTIADDSELYVSDENGVYVIENLDVPDVGRRITIKREGYYTQVKMLNGRSNSTKTMEVILVKVTESILINSGEEGVLNGGGRLRLPSKLQTLNGSEYTGPVSVQSHYYDPNNANYIQEGPGNMLGLNSSDEYVLLGSLGMYFIELSHPETGEELIIPEGNTARISFPVASSQAGDILASVPLWSMDEDLGIWQYEGDASLIDDMLVADVSHFSWWNCDLPYPFVPFCATFLDGNGDVVSGLKVNAYISNQGFGNDVTDTEGKIYGKLPREQLIDLRLRYHNEDLESIQIGPFLDPPIDITVSILEIPRVIGKVVDCNLMSINNGYGLVNLENGVIPIVINEDGSFSYLLPDEDHSLLLVNRETNEFESVAITSSQEDLFLDDVQLCNQLNAGRLHGKVMIDEDEDGVSDVPLEGVEILVRNVVTQQIDFSITSKVDGSYSVMVVPNVEYELYIEELPDIRVMYQGDLTPEDNLDKELWTSRTRAGSGIAAVLEDIDEIDENNDFQLVYKGVGEVNGRILRDIDGDDIGDVGLENYEITLFSNTQGTELEMKLLTDAQGEFSIMMSNFIGKLEIDIESIADFDQSPDPDGDDSNEGANREIPIRLVSDEIDSDNIFVVRTEGSITGNVGEDTDNDDLADEPIPGVEIILDAALPDFPISTITDSNGEYSFNDLEPGVYTLMQQNETEIDEDYVDVFDGDESPEDANDAIDALNDDVIYVTLDIGETDEDNNFVEEQVGTISGQLSVDTNEDGLGDLPNSDQIITLLDGNLNLLQTIISDEDGEYEFVGLPTGDYLVQYLAPNGLVTIQEGDESPEDPVDGINLDPDGMFQVQLRPGEDDEDNNFVDRPN